MVNIHFCSEEGMLQGRHMSCNPQLRLDDKNKENLQKLAIKCWILPRLSPGEAMICKKHNIYISDENKL